MLGDTDGTMRCLSVVWVPLGVWHTIRPPEHASAVIACVLGVCWVDEGEAPRPTIATYARDRVRTWTWTMDVLDVLCAGRYGGDVSGLISGGLDAATRVHYGAAGMGR